MPCASSVCYSKACFHRGEAYSRKVSKNAYVPDNAAPAGVHVDTGLPFTYVISVATSSSGAGEDAEWVAQVQLAVQQITRRSMCGCRGSPEMRTLLLFS